MGSRSHIADLFLDRDKVRARRKSFGITPFANVLTLLPQVPRSHQLPVHQVQSSEHDVKFDDNGRWSGSGCLPHRKQCPNRWCAYLCEEARTRKHGHDQLQPRNRFHDFDEADRLYFEELDSKRVWIYSWRATSGVVVSVGGLLVALLIPLPSHSYYQVTPIKYALRLKQNGLMSWGLPEMIDNAEDRHKFSCHPR